MTLRSGIALYAVLGVLSSMTLCQPPRPRITEVEERTSEAVASTWSTAKDFFPACKSG
jgi:hypothetical protein